MKFKLRVDALLSPDGHELLSASKINDVDRVNALLVNAPTLVYYKSIFGGQTAWHQAALHGSSAVLEALSKSVRAHKDRLSKGVLSGRATCFQSGQEETWVEQLSRAVNQDNSRQQTPVMLAAAASQPGALRILLHSGADLHARDSGCRTPLHYAAYSGCGSSCAQLITAAQVEAAATPRPGQYMSRFVDKRTICGLTPLHYAAYYNHLDCAQQLLHAGASLLARCTWSGTVENIWCDPHCTPLHLAARHASPDMAKLLLQALVLRVGSPDVPRNIDPRAQRDRSGRLPLHYVTHTEGPLQHLLHPTTPLEELFEPAELAALLAGPEPTLAQLAAAAHRTFLQARLESLLALTAAGRPSMEHQCTGMSSTAADAGLQDPTPSSCAGQACLELCPTAAAMQPSTSTTTATHTSDIAPLTTSPTEAPAPELPRTQHHSHAPQHPAASADHPATSPDNPAASSTNPADAAEDTGDVSEGQCGVCWTHAASIELQACKHRLCGACSLKICTMPQQAARAPSCPFCRATIRDVRALPHLAPAPVSRL